MIGPMEAPIFDYITLHTVLYYLPQDEWSILSFFFIKIFFLPSSNKTSIFGAQSGVILHILVLLYSCERGGKRK